MGWSKGAPALLLPPKGFHKHTHLHISPQLILFYPFKWKGKDISVAEFLGNMLTNYVKNIVYVNTNVVIILWSSINVDLRPNRSSWVRLFYFLFCCCFHLGFPGTLSLCFSHQPSLEVKQHLSIVDLTGLHIAEAAVCGGAMPLSGTCLSSHASHPLIHKISNIWGTICWPAVTSTHACAHKRGTLTHLHTDILKHIHKHLHTHTRMNVGIQWHTHTQALRELKSAHIPHSYVPWLFSITAVFLRWCICDIWRHSLYSCILRRNTRRKGREKGSATKEKRDMAGRDGRAAEGKQGKELG